jgi:hypothetical protein
MPVAIGSDESPQVMSPIALIPANNQRLGPQASSQQFRCRGKGFLLISLRGLPGVTRLDLNADGSRKKSDLIVNWTYPCFHSPHQEQSLMFI